MSEEIDNVEVSEDPAPSEETAQPEGEIKQEGEQAEPKSDGSYVETDNANIQARFNTITSQRKQAEDKAKELQARLDKIDADNLTATINKKPPEEQDFDYDQEQFQAARDAHNVAVGRAQGQQETAEQAIQQRQIDAQNLLNQSYVEKATKFVEKTPDYEQSISALGGLNQNVANHIKALDNSPELFYELSKNMNLANQLNNAANAGDGIMAGNIIAQVQASIKSAPKDKKVTGAGSPIDSPIQGGVSPDNPDKQYKHIGGAKFF